MRVHTTLAASGSRPLIGNRVILVTDWGLALRMRAQRLMLISMLVLIAIIKDIPIVSCGKN